MLQPEFLLNAVIGILGFVIAFGLAVFVHELGHFLAAKLFKVPVERFVVGFDKEAMPFMPKCIFERRMGETTYGLSLVPLGGYVKMAGIVHPDIEAYLEGQDEKAKNKNGAEEEAAPEASEPEPEEQAATKSASDAPSLPENVRPDTLTGQAIQDQTALYQKPFWQKFIIYSAGVFMNLVLAALVLAFMQWRGVLVEIPQPAVVSWQQADSWLVQQGVLPGDRIVSLNGEDIATDIDYLIALDRTLRELAPDEPLRVEMTVVRNGEQHTIELETPWDRSGTLAMNELPEGQRLLSLATSRPAYMEYVIPDRQAWRGGMRRGDLVLTLGGEPARDWQQFAHTIREALDEDLTMEVERAPEEIAVHISATELVATLIPATRGAVAEAAGESYHPLDRPLVPIVSWLPEQSDLYRQGLRPRDVIMRIEGERVFDRNDAVEAIRRLAGEAAGGEVQAEFVVRRFEERPERGMFTREVPVRFTPQLDGPVPLVELLSFPPIVGPDSTATGLQPGDRVTMFDNQSVQDYAHLRELASNAGDRRTRLRVERPSIRETLVVRPRESTDIPGAGAIGVMPGDPDSVREHKTAVAALMGSPAAVGNTTLRYIDQLGTLGGRLIRGDVRKVREDLGGPVGIARMAGVHATMGLDYYLRFLIILNIALAVINILPIPILDGGHIVLAAYEGVVGKPVPPKVLAPVLNGALFVLLGFVVLITFSDVLKIFF